MKNTAMPGICSLLVSGFGSVVLCFACLMVNVDPAWSIQSAETVGAPGSETYAIQGRVLDAADGRPLIGANIVIAGSERGTVTNRFGLFEIRRIHAREVRIRIQYLGYSAIEEQLRLPADAGRELEFRLQPSLLETDEVVVTGTPTGSQIGYQPSRALNMEDLQRHSGTSLGEMMDGQPGLAMRSFGPATTRPVIRGLDGDRVLVIENGERMGDLSESAADHAISMDPLSANRVEVVRGPASVLYGSSALGGVVHVLNEDIPTHWSRGLSGTAALQGATVNLSGAGFGRIVAGLDKWAATGRFSYRSAGNTVTPKGTLPGTFLRNITGGGGAGFEATDVQGGVSFGSLEKEYGLPEEFDKPLEEIEIRMYRQNMQGVLKWQPQSFIQNAELRMSANRYGHDEVEIEWDEGRETYEEDLELSFHQRSVSSTLTIQHRPIRLVTDGAFGLQILWQDLSVGGFEALTPDAVSFFASAFIFEEVELTPAIRLQLGGRLERQFTRARPNEKFKDFEAERNANIFSGSVGLNVRPARSLETGFQLARAHRAPAIEELYANAPHLGVSAYEIGDPDLKNEIGIGADFFASYTSEHLQAEVAVFYNRIDNYVIRQPTGEIHEPSGFPVFVFEGDNAELVGGEFLVEAVLPAGLRLRTGVDYVRGTRRDVAGIPLPFIPPLRMNLGLTYDNRTWWVGGESRLIRSQGRVAVGEEPTDGYLLLGMEAGYRLHQTGRHVLALRVDNLLNTTYRDHLSRVEDRNYPMPGRNANMTYRWLF